jgi:hypothetical protein
MGLKVGDHVNQKGTDSPTGVIQEIHGRFAKVRWGVQDRRVFEDDFALEDLQPVPYEIITPDEVEKRMVENSRRGLPKK